MEEEQPPRRRVQGPTLPPHLLAPEGRGNAVDDVADVAGPELPPHLAKKRAEAAAASAGDVPARPATIGPQIPAHLLQAFSRGGESESEEEDDDMVGPAPLAAGEDASAYELAETQRQFEERALRMKRRVENPNEEATVRESWMTELPEQYRKAMGTEAGRKFRTRAPDEDMDRSEWTETPSDRKRKEEGLDTEDSKDKKKHKKHKKHKHERHESKDEIEHRMRKDKHREKSLMELHQSKRVDEFAAKSKDGGAERQTWNWERDMAIGGKLDPAKKGNIIKGAAAFQSRFTSASK